MSTTDSRHQEFLALLPESVAAGLTRSNSGDALILVDGEGRIMEASTEAEALFGYGCEELRGNTIELLVPEHLRRNHESDRDAFVARGKARPMRVGVDLAARHKSGWEFPVEIGLEPVRNADGSLVLCTIRDFALRWRSGDIMDRQIATTWLLGRIASVANEANSSTDALRVAIEQVCALTGWPVGHAYRLGAEGDDTLLPSTLWYLEDPDRFEIFRRVTMETSFTAGVGLPGRVLESGRPAWIVDVTADSNFPRAKLARNIGVKAGFGFPVLVGSRVAAVLEFFSPRAEAPNEALLRTMELIGVQLGRTIEREWAEAALRDSEARFKHFADAASDWFWEMGPDLRFTYHSARYFELTGFRPEDKIGTTRTRYVDQEALAADDTKWAAHLADLEAHRAFKNFEYAFTVRDGSNRHVRISGIPVFTGAGEFAGYRGTGSDITDQKQAQEALSLQATHDALTGLMNRREFEQRLGRVLDTARTAQDEHAFCYLDLDQFKVINDTCGHMAGDELLRQLAHLLSASVRKRDTLARLGGDEFGVLMEHCTLEQARRVANKVRRAVAEFRFAWEKQVFRIGVSIGLVPISAASGSVTSLMSAADSACYAAKDEGRNRVHVYRLDDTELARRQGEMQWVARIDQALEDQRLRLWSQPIVPLMGDSGEGKHFELLLRLVDERGATILPGVFLPAAERYGLSTKLDRWVIGAALDWLSRDPELLARLHLCCINLSGASLADEEFLEFVQEQFEKSQVPARKICFEVTETAAIANLSRAMIFMGALKEQGCRFALDDFGSGLSSFAYLKTLPVDYLKIDGAFVRDIVDDDVDLALVRAINDVGKVMGKQTIAEFVENDAIREKLGEIGVDYAQGYGIGRPVPIAETS